MPSSVPAGASKLRSAIYVRQYICAGLYVVHAMWCNVYSARQCWPGLVSIVGRDMRGRWVGCSPLAREVA
eukprot:3176319-Pyramimonas_sp.AAC.1